jgi:hypothetical protein
VPDTLLERAVALLEQNTRTAERDGRRFRFSIPSARRYPFQWFWDSCFHAIVWSHVDRERARDELRALFAAQGADGFIPHLIFWDQARVARFGWHWVESKAWPGMRPRTSAEIQPPVIAQAAEIAAGPDGAELAAELLPGLERSYRYLASQRDDDGDGLITIVSQFESGLDFSPVYDPRRGRETPSPSTISVRGRAPLLLNKAVGWKPGLALRLNPHRFVDVLVNSVYADGLHALARMAERAGDACVATWAGERARAVRDGLLERCWDERRGLFYDLAGRTGRRADRTKTIVSLFPLLLPDLPAEVAARLVEHLTDPREFWTEFPVPSVAIDEPAFTRDSRVAGRRLIWRGPCSLSTNWLLVRGLRRHGFGDAADRIAERSRDVVEHGGFNEFYDPLDGTPVGEPEFGWATLAAVI